MGAHYFGTGTGDDSAVHDVRPVRLAGLRLRQPGKTSDGEGRTDRETTQKAAESAQEKSFIICRQCRKPITLAQERFSVQGAHRHTFANPHGLVFDIGCFRNTVGCGYAGPDSGEFTWFAGYRWRVCYCAGCLTHLGWLFTSSGGDAFHGLILERLIELE